MAFWEAETFVRPIGPIVNKGPFVILFGSEFSTTKTEQQEPSVVSFASKLCKALDRAAGASVHPALHFTEPEAACEALRWMVDVPFLGFLGARRGTFCGVFHLHSTVYAFHRGFLWVLPQALISDGMGVQDSFGVRDFFRRCIASQ